MTKREWRSWMAFPSSSFYPPQLLQLAPSVFYYVTYVYYSETFNMDYLVSYRERSRHPILAAWCMAGYLTEWSWFIDFRDIYAKRHFFYLINGWMYTQAWLKWYFEIINKSHFRIYIYIFFFNMINNWMNNACFFTIFI